jgi:hypothetical protein
MWWLIDQANRGAERRARGKEMNLTSHVMIRMDSITHRSLKKFITDQFPMGSQQTDGDLDEVGLSFVHI